MAHEDGIDVLLSAAVNQPDAAALEVLVSGGSDERQDRTRAAATVQIRLHAAKRRQELVVFHGEPNVAQPTRERLRRHVTPVCEEHERPAGGPDLLEHLART